MGRGVIRIDLDCATVLAFGNRPVEVMTDSCKAERAVSFGGRGVQLNCFGSVLFCGG
jgi:hypothetical protein